MHLSVKVLSKSDTVNGFLVRFEGYENGEKFLESALHFSSFSTPGEVLEACVEEVRAAVKPLPGSPDLSFLLNKEHFIDSDMDHPLYGAVDPVQAKNAVERFIAARLEQLIVDSGLVDRYPGVERDTWKRQIDEALKYKKGYGSAFIVGVANSAAGETPEELADSILNNAADFMAAAGPLFKAKHELVSALDSLPNDMEAIRHFFDNQASDWNL